MNQVRITFRWGKFQQTYLEPASQHATQETYLFGACLTACNRNILLASWNSISNM